MKKKIITIPKNKCEDCQFHKREVHDYWRCCIYMKLRKAHPNMGFLKPKWCKLIKVTLEEVEDDS